MPFKKLKSWVVSLAFGLVFLPVDMAPSIAQVPSNALSQCLVMKTTGEDRVVMVRWLALSLSSHPALTSDIKVSQSIIDDANEKMAHLFYDLLTVKCLTEAKSVLGADATGQEFKNAFSILGQVSAQEILGNDVVAKKTIEFMNKLDASALRKALQ